MKNYVLALIALSLAFYCNTAYASHAAGANLSYVCVDDSTVIIYLELFRDCTGIPVATTQIIYISSTSCGITDTIIATKPNISCDTIIDHTCNDPDYTINCACNGTPSIPLNIPPAGMIPPYVYPAVELYLYTATYSLPKNAMGNLICCPDLTFNTSIGARNPATNTGSGNLVLYSTINTCNVPACGNSNPVLYHTPVNYVCEGQPFNLSPGSYDLADNHELKFKLVPVQSNFGTLISYVPPLTFDQPFMTTPPSSLTFDTLTGNFGGVLAPNQQATIGIEISEYNAQGQLVGTVLEELYIFTLDCDLNAAPSDTLQIDTIINGSRESEFSFTADCGQTMTIEFSINDTNIADSITVETLPLSNYTLTCSNALTTTNCTLTWNASNTYEHSYVAINVKDNACPFTANQKFTLHITNNCTPPVSIENIGFGNLSVYPNPTKDVVYFDLGQFSGDINDANIHVYDLVGKSYQPSIKFNNNKGVVDMRTMPNGVYYIQINGKEHSYLGKVIKL